MIKLTSVAIDQDERTAYGIRSTAAALPGIMDGVSKGSPQHTVTFRYDDDDSELAVTKHEITVNIDPFRMETPFYPDVSGETLQYQAIYEAFEELAKNRVLGGLPSAFFKGGEYVSGGLALADVKAGILITAITRSITRSESNYDKPAPSLSLVVGQFAYGENSLNPYTVCLLNGNLSVRADVPTGISETDRVTIYAGLLGLADEVFRMTYEKKTELSSRLAAAYGDPEARAEAESKKAAAAKAVPDRGSVDTN
ncbi:MAG: hypothetical protein V1820_06465 [archaeon]